MYGKSSYSGVTSQPLARSLLLSSATEGGNTVIREARHGRRNDDERARAGVCPPRGVQGTKNVASLRRRNVWGWEQCEGMRMESVACPSVSLFPLSLLLVGVSAGEDVERNRKWRLILP